jgi:hypothetical protein
MPPEQKVSVIEEIISNNLPTETVFGYVMYPPNQLTDAEVINAMRYNDSKDTHFILFFFYIVKNLNTYNDIFKLNFKDNLTGLLITAPDSSRILSLPSARE